MTFRPNSSKPNRRSNGGGVGGRGGAEGGRNHPTSRHFKLGACSQNARHTLGRAKKKYTKQNMAKKPHKPTEAKKKNLLRSCQSFV